MPRVRDLTNSSWINLGAYPRSSDDEYMRHMGAGFFTEWGNMGSYADAGFVYYDYWTSDINVIYLLTVSMSGHIDNRRASTSYYAVCTAP